MTRHRGEGVERYVEEATTHADAEVLTVGVRYRGRVHGWGHDDAKRWLATAAYKTATVYTSPDDAHVAALAAFLWGEACPTVRSALAESFVKHERATAT